jgi:hypothetical protein
LVFIAKKSEIKFFWTSEEKLIFNCERYNKDCPGGYGKQENPNNVCGKGFVKMGEGEKTVCFPVMGIANTSYFGVWSQKYDITLLKIVMQAGL